MMMIALISKALARLSKCECIMLRAVDRMSKVDLEPQAKSLWSQIFQS
jgi:hypothetical protein